MEGASGRPDARPVLLSGPPGRELLESAVTVDPGVTDKREHEQREEGVHDPRHIYAAFRFARFARTP